MKNLTKMLPPCFSKWNQKRPFVAMNDGVVVSIQASWGHYCTPTVDGADEYSEFEVGYMSDGDPRMLFDYRQSDDLDIFPYVPASVVMEFIESHGGIKQFD